jgi:hypothetical protein
MIQYDDTMMMQAVDCARLKEWPYFVKSKKHNSNIADVSVTHKKDLIQKGHTSKLKRS